MDVRISLYLYPAFFFMRIGNHRLPITAVAICQADRFTRFHPQHLDHMLRSFFRQDDLLPYLAILFDIEIRYRHKSIEYGNHQRLGRRPAGKQHGTPVKKYPDAPVFAGQYLFIYPFRKKPIPKDLSSFPLLCPSPSSKIKLAKMVRLAGASSSDVRTVPSTSKLSLPCIMACCDVNTASTDCTESDGSLRKMADTIPVAGRQRRYTQELSSACGSRK